MFKAAEDSENGCGSQDLKDSALIHSVWKRQWSHISLPSHTQHSQTVTIVNRVISTAKV